jgi:hypothetical protein
MTDYKTLFGKKIKFQTTDLTMSTATEGELFFSGTDKEFKVGIVVQAWTSGEALTQIRRNGGGTGPQTAGMVFGGMDAPSQIAKTETYDGTDWTEVADLNTARGKIASATAGSQTAALAFGGATAEPSPPASVGIAEEWNGTSWAESGDLNTARHFLAGAGTQTAALGFAGYTTDNHNESEEYNGTSWTEGNNLNTARSYLAGCGTQTAALCIQGHDGSNSAVTEEYDGSSWTNVTSCPFTAHTNSAAGTQTNAITFAGSPNRTTVAGYDGTSWAAKPSMGTGRDSGTGFGTGANAVCAGADGGSPANEGVGTVEEFTSTVTLKTVTDS